MNRNNQNAFTLVELLAVIVILAVILVIAVPQVMNIIEDTKRASFASTVKILANSAEKKYVQNEILGVNEKIDCSTVSKLNKEDYSTCNISINNGVALVTLVGSGKFEGMKVLNGTKTAATVISSDSEELYTLEDVYNMLGDLTSRLEQVEDKQENTTNITLLSMYPVGSVYVSTNDKSPEELFGGEWITFGNGRTLVGVDSSQTEFASVELTGGEKAHTITIEEMPNHNHAFLDFWTVIGASEETHRYAVALNGDGNGTSGTSNNRSFTNYSGGSQPHNNLQPYITVYMWKRTA